LLLNSAHIAAYGFVEVFLQLAFPLVDEWSIFAYEEGSELSCSDCFPRWSAISAMVTVCAETVLTELVAMDCTLSTEWVSFHYMIGISLMNLIKI